MNEDLLHVDYLGTAGTQLACLLHIILLEHLVYKIVLCRLSIGTAYGVGLFDYARCKTVYTKCTFASSGKRLYFIVTSHTVTNKLMSFFLITTVLSLFSEVI